MNSPYAHHPLDWDDHAGWDKHFTARLASDAFRRGVWFQQEALELQLLARNLRPADYPVVWVAGCGVSMVGHFLAAHGFRVVATDASAVAIQAQRRLDTVGPLHDFLPSPARQPPHPAPTFQHHDFRQGPPLTGVDLVLNIRAFHLLKGASLAAAARAHHAALRPGGLAIFSTANMHGERATVAEQALVAAGFVVPGVESLAWVRTELAALQATTGAEALFFPGQPVQLVGASSAATRQAVATLESEFGQRFAQERARQQAARRADPTLKRAQVIYMAG